MLKGASNDWVLAPLGISVQLKRLLYWKLCT